MTLDPKRPEAALKHEAALRDLYKFCVRGTDNPTASEIAMRTMRECVAELETQLAAANARIAELEAAMQWRDMSTAPTNGTPVLLLLKEGVVQGRWGEDECYSSRGEEWGVLHLGVHGCGCCSYGGVEPLGWMPAPPAQEASDEA